MFRSKSTVSIETENSDTCDLELSIGTTNSKAANAWASNRKKATANALALKKERAKNELQRTREEGEQKSIDIERTVDEMKKSIPTDLINPTYRTGHLVEIIWKYKIFPLLHLTWFHKREIRFLSKMFSRTLDPTPPNYIEVPSLKYPTLSMAVQYARLLYLNHQVKLAICLLPSTKHKTHEGKHRYKRQPYGRAPQLLTNDLNLDFPVSLLGGGMENCLVFGCIHIDMQNITKKKATLCGEEITVEHLCVTGSAENGIVIQSSAKLFHVDVTRNAFTGIVVNQLKLIDVQIVGCRSTLNKLHAFVIVYGSEMKEHSNGITLTDFCKNDGLPITLSTFDTTFSQPGSASDIWK